MTHAILTCSEHFVPSALNEIQRHHPALIVNQSLSPQHLLLENDSSFDVLTRPWRHKLPIYLHHLFPVHRELALHGKRYDLDHLKTIASQLISASQQVTVQARFADDTPLPYEPCEIEQYINPNQPHNNCENIPSGRILSILIACVGNRLKAYMGVSWATQNISPFTGGIYPHSRSLPNRAGFKLIEAIDTFGVRLWEDNHALDLGAAPGAWAMVLRKHKLRVTTVAPDKLYPFLAKDRAIRHYHMTAEDYLKHCDVTYDLITNDMIMEAQYSARLIVSYAPFLRSQGIAIMTLKLRIYNRRSVMDHALRILRKAYKIIRIRQLISNRNEVTLFLRKKK